MIDSTDTFLSKLRFVPVAVLMMASVLILPSFLSAILATPKAHASGTNSVSRGRAAADDNPNIIADGMTAAAARLGNTLDSTEKSVSSGVNSAKTSVAMATIHSGRFVAHVVSGSATFTARTVSHGVTFTAHTSGRGLTFIAHAAGKPFSLIKNPPQVGSIITPAEADKTPLPAIDSDTAVLAETQTAPPGNQVAKQTAVAPVDPATSWPIHGVVTLEFGVVHWPYQPTHTGIDISDGRPSGVTPIKVFKAGRVIEVVHSNSGFGNHVIVDHGGGLVSLYGHLYSTSVQVGQEVDRNTKLGFEGSTGASTGPHLHFEIRLNGQPVNPRLYISGQP